MEAHQQQQQQQQGGEGAADGAAIIDMSSDFFLQVLRAYPMRYTRNMDVLKSVLTYITRHPVILSDFSPPDLVRLLSVLHDPTLYSRNVSTVRDVAQMAPGTCDVIDGWMDVCVCVQGPPAIDRGNSFGISRQAKPSHLIAFLFLPSSLHRPVCLSSVRTCLSGLSVSQSSAACLPMSVPCLLPSPPLPLRIYRVVGV
mmetsp:Transcript_24648/g.71116  ORF Transcript_24648/g.71116 Transcript_24648/m.71116 type:complete len:198 (+) Transcript_24648:2-595(+)